jgi:hypothetical protein
MQPSDYFHLPEDISDEAAYELYELLEGLVMAVEERYRYRIRRHLQNCARERRVELGNEEDEDEIGF